MNRFSIRQTAVCTAFIALLVYILTMPSGLTWQHFGVDGGELIAASYTLGIAHPPGYPLYILLGKLFSFLPIGSIAYRYNLFSAVCMAVAIGLITAVCHRRAHANNALFGCVGGLTFAFASLIWQQAIIAEVYALYLAFFAATLWQVSQNSQPRDVVMSGILFGLTLVSHLTGVFLVVILLVETPRAQWRWLALGTAVGLLPLLSLPLLAQSGSPVIWGEPTTVSGWFELVTAQIYRQNGFLLAWPAIGERLSDWGATWLNQFTLAGAPLIVWSIWRHPTKRTNRLVWGATAVLYLLFALLYPPADAIVMSTPAILILCVLLIDGLTAVGKWSLCLPLVLLLLNFPLVNISQDRFVHQQIEQLLTTVPLNAVLETSGEPILFALWYVNYVEGKRTDIEIVDNDLFAFSWYRQQVETRIAGYNQVEEDDIEKFRQTVSAQRPYCILTTTNDNPATYRPFCP